MQETFQKFSIVTENAAPNETYVRMVYLAVQLCVNKFCQINRKHDHFAWCITWKKKEIWIQIKKSGQINQNDHHFKHEFWKALF
jgi:hypothetical protein